MSEVIAIQFNPKGLVFKRSYSRFPAPFDERSWMLRTAKQAIEKEDLTDEEKFAIAAASGVTIHATHEEATLSATLTTEPCGLYRHGGKWRVVVHAK